MLAKQKKDMDQPIRIAACGCGLIDRLYADVNFEGGAFAGLRSESPGDGGLVPGHLVFAEALAAFGGRDCGAIREALVGGADSSVAIGGPALVALIAARQSAGVAVDAAFYGVRGADEDGLALGGLLAPHDLDLQHYLIVGGATPSTLVLSDPRYDEGRGERTFINRIGAAGAYAPAALPDSFFDADIRIFGGTALVPELHDALDELLLRTSGHGLNIVNTVYDFRNQQRDPDGAWPLVRSREACERVDLLICDGEEARRISGLSLLEDACGHFIGLGYGAVIITEGAEPVIYQGGMDSVFGQLPMRRRGVCGLVSEELREHSGGDTTGCGDNFVGGVVSALVQLLRGKGSVACALDLAVCRGIAAGGAACFDVGGVVEGAASTTKWRRAHRYFEDLRLSEPGPPKGRFVQFGAGNIGRSLMGDVFSHGYAIQFVDVDLRLIAALNKEGAYEVTYRDAGLPDRVRVVDDVSAIDARDLDAVIAAIEGADLIGVSVGKAALPHVAKVLAEGLSRRVAGSAADPVNVIVAENLRDGGAYLRGLVNAELSLALSEEAVGFVSTCVGRMVPVQESGSTDAELVAVFAESASDFYGGIDDFVGAVPSVPGFRLVASSKAFVDRKLFIHNMTHSAVAFLASQQLPDAITIAEGVRNSVIRAVVRKAAEEVIAGLMHRYPDVFSESELHAYCDGLLERYDNEALGDTIQRVGRDLPRKLSKGERLIGPYLLLVEHDFPRIYLRQTIAAAFAFPDSVHGGRRLEDDARLDLAEFCGLRRSDPVEGRVCEELEALLPLAMVGAHR